MTLEHALRGRTRYPGLVNPSIRNSNITLEYVSNAYDGFMNYFGTAELTLAFSNPCRTIGDRIAIFTASQINNQDGTRLAYCATDHSLTESNGCSHTQNTSNAWWKIDFGISKKINPKHIALVGRATAGSHPRNFKLQGSNNNSDWDDLLTVVGEGPNNGTWWTSAITGSSAYRYLRIYQTGVNSDGYNYLVIGEIEFWGVVKQL